MPNDISSNDNDNLSRDFRPSVRLPDNFVHQVGNFIIDPHSGNVFNKNEVMKPASSMKKMTFPKSSEEIITDDPNDENQQPSIMELETNDDVDNIHEFYVDELGDYTSDDSEAFAIEAAFLLASNNNVNNINESEETMKLNGVKKNKMGELLSSSEERRGYDDTSKEILGEIFNNKESGPKLRRQRRRRKRPLKKKKRPLIYGARLLRGGRNINT